MADVVVRPAVAGDVAAIGGVAEATGPDDDRGAGNPAYLRHLSENGRVVVAGLGGRIAGFGAVQRVGQASAAVTMLCDLFVDPAAQGRGCGRAMLAELWAGSSRRMTFSSLHANAVPLYTSFGLDAWWPLLYLHGEPSGLPAGQRAGQWVVERALPAPHPAVRALLAAGWHVGEFDLFMASEPGVLDPRRAVPSPARA